MLDDGVAFAFGAAEPSTSETHKLSERFERIRADIVGTDKRFLIDSQASSPGSSDFNQALSDQRAEWLKAWLVEQGVALSQIEVRSHGEGHADQIGDSAYNRVALWQVEDALEATAVESSFITRLEERFPIVADDRAAGERKFADAVGPLADLVRELYTLPDNPVFPDPSADPVHFLKQTGGVVFDFFGPPTSVEDVALEGIANKGKGIDVKGLLSPGPLEIAEGAAGAAIGVARENMRREVADARRSRFDALETAVVAALTGHDLDLGGMDATNRALASTLYNRLVVSSSLEKYQMAIFLVEVWRAGHIYESGPPELSYLSSHLNGVTVRSAVDTIFSDREYSSSSSDPGELYLFGLKLVTVDGVVQVVDSIGQVIGSSGADGQQASPDFDMENDSASRGFNIAANANADAGMFDMPSDVPVGAPGAVMPGWPPGWDDPAAEPAEPLPQEPSPAEPSPEQASPDFDMENDSASRGFNIAANANADAGMFDMRSDVPVGAGWGDPAAEPAEPLPQEPSPEQVVDVDGSGAQSAG